MKLRQRQSAGLKTKLSGTLHSWLPILQSGLDELEELLRKHALENPYMEIRSGYEERYASPSSGWERFGKRGGDSSRTETIEAMAVAEKSLYDILHEQIGAPLFPTPRSEAIAYEIVREISHEGYFEGDVKAIAEKTGVDAEEVEKIRSRFAFLDPPGVGALDVAEAMIFQLLQSDLEEPLHSRVMHVLEDFRRTGRLKLEGEPPEVLATIRRFRNPPALETLEASPPVVPDLVVSTTERGIEVAINDDFYPDISVREPDLDHRYVRRKIKEARDLIDALRMRRATLYKVGLMIVEFQYDFFQGGEMRPMTLKDIAEEFDHNPSTISRAIANKYLMCDRGIFPMKSFFTAGVSEEVSNAAIKRFIAETIASEDRKKPFSDQKLLEMIEEKFGVKMVRRTVTKYRKQMQIGGSSERRKLYGIV
ncbi:RNA polymerase factor sigma-54 [Hydrogenimonas sp.]